MRKKYLFLIFSILPLQVFASRFISSVDNKEFDNKYHFANPNVQECYVDIDYCFDRYCFDKKSLQDGLYSRCGAEPASRILANVNECLETRSVIKKLDLKNGCENYSYQRVLSNLQNKDNIEEGLKENTAECRDATKALAAAKNCYGEMISHSGEVDLALYDTLEALCGFDVSGDSYMLNRFYNAGNYGKSNIGAIEDLKLTGQNTVKRENWRQVVEATLVSYTEIAELACGKEDYTIAKVNQYQLDNRDNLAMVQAKETAKQIGKQTATRIVDGWFAKDDCLNASVPVGASRWTYSETSSPNCKIICKEGYNPNSNFTSCVEDKADDDKPVFLGFNLGGWIEEPVYTEPVVQQPQNDNYIPSVDNLSSSSLGSDKKEVPSICSKSLPNQLWTTTKDGVCEVFFPGGVAKSFDATKGTYFCIGNVEDIYTHWLNMTFAELKGYFGTNASKFTELYPTIEKYCRGDRGGNITPTTTTSDPVIPPVSDDEITYESILDKKIIVRNSKNLEEWGDIINHFKDEDLKCYSDYSYYGYDAYLYDYAAQYDGYLNALNYSKVSENYTGMENFLLSFKNCVSMAKVKEDELIAEDNKKTKDAINCRYATSLLVKISDLGGKNEDGFFVRASTLDDYLSKWSKFIKDNNADKWSGWGRTLNSYIKNYYNIPEEYDLDLVDFIEFSIIPEIIKVSEKLCDNK